MSDTSSSTGAAVIAISGLGAIMGSTGGEHSQKQILFENIDKYMSQFEQDKLSQQEINQNIVQAMQQLLRQSVITRMFKDEKQQFQFRSVNISDPLMPSNNIGKTVSEASLKRMKRVFQLGYYNIRKLLRKTLDGHYTVAECVAEFDINFVNTLATCDVSELAMIADHNFDVLKGDQTSLQNACMSVIHQGMGVVSGVRIFCDK